MNQLVKEFRKSVHCTFAEVTIKHQRVYFFETQCRYVIFTYTKCNKCRNVTVLLMSPNTIFLTELST